MKKSMMSKKGSAISFLNGGIKDDATLQLMRISLKKEGDRRQRLEKLLSKYEFIRSEERNHIKTIKANIIQLKDRPTVPKIHFLIDPNIYVDNNLSIQTREFLCMLLNTFYKRYQQNSEYEHKAAKIVESIRGLIKTISYNEELLFKVQKLNINHQVQLEGELLSEKNKLKEEAQKMKELDTEQKRIKVIWDQNKAKYDEEREKMSELQKIVAELESKIIGLTEKINKGEEIRQGNQQKLSGEMAYQSKFQEEVNHLKKAITDEYAREKQLKKKIMEKRLKIEKMKGFVNYDNKKHEMMMRLLDLEQPRPSTRVHGVGQILELENTFAKTLSQTWGTTA